MAISGVHAGMRRAALVVAMLFAAPAVRADVVTDTNARAAEIVSRLTPTPAAVRAMAIVQLSVFEGVNAITARFPAYRVKVDAAPGASVEAAVAAAARTAMLVLVPAEQAAIEAEYRASLAALPDGPDKAAGVAVGERAARAVLASCADDGAIAPDAYRPEAPAGVYVPTALPAVPHWGRRRPWAMARGDALRPGPPPALASETWARDYEEIRAIGAKYSSRRTPEQTAIARFWEATAPTIYWPVARSVALSPGREVTANARLLAIAGLAMDDAIIAVFDAKYAYAFWRPITAIRNGDHDGNDATAAEPGWAPLIDTPMHPEYPCAHCIVAAALGAVLEAEIAGGPVPRLVSTSPTAPGIVRSWASVGEFVREVSDARIYDGVHYRNSTEVGAAMGAKIGALEVRSFPTAKR